MTRPKTKRTLALSLSAAAALAIGIFFAMQPGIAEPSKEDGTPILTVETVPLVKLSAYDSDTLYPGRVRALRRSQLGFERGGMLAQVLVDEGQTLLKGAQLASLDLRAAKAEHAAANANLAAAKAALVDAKANADLARATIGRQAELLKKGHISQQRFDDARYGAASADARATSASAQILQAQAQLDAANAALSLSQLTAPFDGVVVRRMADEGTILAPGTPIFDFEETGIREFVSGVPADVASNIAEGYVGAITVNAKRYSARLKQKVTALDSSTRTAQLIFDLPPDANAMSGSVGQLALKQTFPQGGFWVPIEALQEGQRGLWSVLVAGADDQGMAALERHPVELLHAELGRAFVAGSIQDGDRLVTSGLNRLIAGQRVRVARQSAGR